MPTFLWEGKTAQGKIIRDEIEASSREAVFAILRERRIRPIPTRIREKGAGMEKEIRIPGFGESVKPKEVAVFTRQFATMIDAGLPIVQCLSILGEQTQNKTFRRTLLAIRKDVEGGTTLAEGLKKHPKIFDDLYVNMVEAGEMGGALNTILNRIAVFIEKANKLKKKVKGAMIYPSSIMGVAVIVVSVLMIFVIPVFAELYGSMGKALPAPTQIAINISNCICRLLVSHFWRHDRRGRGNFALLQDSRRTHAYRSDACSECRLSAIYCARSRWRASRKTCRYY